MVSELYATNLDHSTHHIKKVLVVARHCVLYYKLVFERENYRVHPKDEVRSCCSKYCPDVDSVMPGAARDASRDTRIAGEAQASSAGVQATKAVASPNHCLALRSCVLQCICTHVG
jgi:hypothetical protein